jgi:hypothetical protein
MSRLFDELSRLFTPIVPPVVVDISNIGAYYGLTEKPEWDYENDFPNSAPPFPHAFYEMHEPPRKMFDGEVREVQNPKANQFGLLVRSFEIDSPDFEWQLANVRRNLPEHRAVIEQQLVGSKWLCVVQGYCHLAFMKAVERPLTAVYGVTAIGQLHDVPNGFMTCVDAGFCDRLKHVISLPKGARDDITPGSAFASEMINPYLLALSFMHCKNVVRKENVPPPKVQARRAKDGKPPLTKYYTLEIEAMKRTLQSEGGISTNGLKRALHICRGHFATYSADKPLFGHYVGAVWKPQHVKGSKAAGEIVKDYAVKGPKVTP